MKNTYSMLIMILFSCLSLAQNDERKLNDLVDRFSQELYQNGMETFFYNKRYCIGRMVMLREKDGSMCFSSGTYYEVYFFWRNGEKVMMKKIDNCGQYNEVRIEDSRVFDIFIDREEELKNEEVLGYTVENPENVPALRSEVHPCRREFKFNYHNNVVMKEYELYDLTNESKYQNIYYEQNKNVSMVHLDSIIDDLIKANQSKFIREKK